MTYGIIKVEQLKLGSSGSLAKVVGELNIEPCDILEVHTISFRGHLMNKYKKDVKYKKALNKILSTDFLAVFRCEKNAGESFRDDSVPLDGDILVLKSDNNWISMGSTEWGSIHKT